MKKHLNWISVLGLSVSISTHVYAENTQQSDPEFEKCLLKKIQTASADTTVAELKNSCLQQLTNQPKVKIGAISNRFISEKANAFDPYVITPHKMNYILPASISDGINQTAYQNFSNWSSNLEDLEAKFQLSVKVPLNKNSIFTEGDGLFFGMTLQSWWQVYSSNISKPFRETNYQPEVFYITPLNWHPLEGNTGLVIGLEHQSNGRSQLLSRSWNRAYLNFLYEKDNFALSFRPWWRLPEDERTDPLSTEGDDNPDIDDYMGHFELATVYKWHHYELSAKARQNFATHKGALELGFTFPLWGKLRGYAQYFNGYGESLIDYNHNQQRFGIGIALTDIL